MSLKHNFRLTIVGICLVLINAQEYRPQINCSQTSTTTETRCERVTTDTICPNGYTLNENESRCVLNPDEIRCPDTFEFNGTSCIYKEIICANGYYFDSYENECVVSNKECPEGYVKDGDECTIRKQCEATHEFDEATQQCMIRDRICDAPFKWDENLGKCVKYEYECPIGFTANYYGDCEQVDIVCAIGFRLEGSNCYEPDAVCPTNYTLNGTICIPIFECPLEYKEEDNTCVRDIIECPNNFEWNGQGCVLRAVCSTGYELDTETSKCVKIEQKCQNVTTTNGNCTGMGITTCCDNGFRLVDGKCICKIGMILPNGTCIWEATDEIRCPPGYVPKDGRCQLDVECPHGYYKSGKRCILIPIQCQPGYELIDGRCQKRINCFDGSFYIEGVGCVDCPPGTVLFNGTYCMSNKTCGTGGEGGCRSDNQTHVCGDGFNWNGSQCVPLCSPGLVYKNGVCVRFCHQGILLPNGTCVECPDETFFNGQECVRRGCQHGFVTASDGSCVCPPGFGVTYEGRCVPTPNTCGTGEVLQNGVCVKIQCPDGWSPQNNRCVRICTEPNSKWENGRCVPVETNRCGPGYVQVGNSCIKIICPPNFDLEGYQCIWKACPYGYVRKNNECVPVECGPQFEYLDGKCREKTCRDGYEKDSNGNCKWIGPTVNRCPPGYTYQNGQCVQDNVTPPPVVCPPGFIFKDGRCQILATSCPSGYIFKDGRCQIPVTSCPPGYIFKDGYCQVLVESCPSGYIFKDGRCQLPATSCPPGFIFKDGRCQPAVTSCPPNTFLVNGSCMHFGCPPGYYYANNECYPSPTHIISSTQRPSITTNCSTTSTGRNCVSTTEGGSTIHNHNVIETPNNITVININNVGVYLGACKNGQIKTVVINGNRTEKVDCEEDRNENEVVPENAIDYDENTVNHPNDDQNEGDGDQSDTKCCNVISPRICEKRNDHWVCFNRKRFRCGSFCTTKTVYLTPSRRDCNACIGGGGYRCVHECYRQLNVCETRDCAQIDYDSFCVNYGTGICS